MTIKDPSQILTRGKPFPFHAEMERIPIDTTVGREYCLREVYFDSRTGEERPRILCVLEERWNRDTGELYSREDQTDKGSHVRVNCSSYGIANDIYKLQQAGLPCWLTIEKLPRAKDPALFNYRVMVNDNRLIREAMVEAGAIQQPEKEKK